MWLFRLALLLYQTQSSSLWGDNSEQEFELDNLLSEFYSMLVTPTESFSCSAIEKDNCGKRLCEATCEKCLDRLAICTGSTYEPVQENLFNLVPQDSPILGHSQLFNSTVAAFNQDKEANTTALTTYSATKIATTTSTTSATTTRTATSTTTSTTLSTTIVTTTSTMAVATFPSVKPRLILTTSETKTLVYTPKEPRTEKRQSRRKSMVQNKIGLQGKRIKFRIRYGIQFDELISHCLHFVRSPSPVLRTILAPCLNTVLVQTFQSKRRLTPDEQANRAISALYLMSRYCQIPISGPRRLFTAAVMSTVAEEYCFGFNRIKADKIWMNVAKRPITVDETKENKVFRVVMGGLANRLLAKNIWTLSDDRISKLSQNQTENVMRIVDKSIRKTRSTDVNINVHEIYRSSRSPIYRV